MRSDEAIKRVVVDHKLVDRFWSYVRRGSGCWDWLGARTQDGYGTFSGHGNVTMRAHRISWSIHNGPIPAGAWVLHKCDNAGCVRPSHLYVGTHTDNMRDAVERRTHARGEHNAQSKLTPFAVREIRSLYGKVSRKSIALRFGVDGSTIHRVATGVHWNHV